MSFARRPRARASRREALWSATSAPEDAKELVVFTVLPGALVRGFTLVGFDLLRWSAAGAVDLGTFKAAEHCAGGFAKDVGAPSSGVALRRGAAWGGTAAPAAAEESSLFGVLDGAVLGDVTLG